MGVSSRLPALFAFVAELMLWLLPAGCFLAAYVLHFNGPDSAIEPHLKLVGSFGIAWLGLRLALEHAGSGQLARTLFQLTYGLALAFLLIYYAVVLVGLGSWGRVATWRLMKVYFGQWRDLVAVLDVPVVVVPASLLFVYACSFMLVRIAHKYLPWPRQFAEVAQIRPRMSVLLAVVGLVPVSVLALELYQGMNLRTGEPLQLSLKGGELTQNSQSEGARLLEQRDAEAAAAYRPGSIEVPRNVILIVGDALRGDHLSTFGYTRRTTPYLDSLAEDGKLALAQRIQAVCAESYCGLMGIARSKFVHEFSRASITLQQVLARHGYRIALVLGGDHTNFYGLSEVLGPADLYWDGTMSERYVNDDRAVIERAAQFTRWDGKPTYMQFHLMSSHVLGLRQDAFKQFAPARNYSGRLSGASIESWRTWSRNFYDNGLLQFDSIVKELLATLERRGFLENAVVIITGDHGEMVGEHDYFGHAANVYGPSLDIPLLMLRYGYESQKIEPRAFASQVDIAPTVLQELGLPLPSGWSGVGLQNSTSRHFLHFQQGQRIGLLDLRNSARVWKFWIDMNSEAVYAFDAIRDPEEVRNLIDEVPSRIRSEWMLQLLPASNTIRERVRIDSAGGVSCKPTEWRFC